MCFNLQEVLHQYHNNSVYEILYKQTAQRYVKKMDDETQQQEISGLKTAA